MNIRALSDSIKDYYSFLMAGRDSYTNTPITEENNEEFRRPTQPMPKHFYVRGN